MCDCRQLFGRFCVAFCRRRSKDVETSHESCVCACGGLPLPVTGKPFKPLCRRSRCLLCYLRQCKKTSYTALVIEGKLPDYLADVNEQAEEMLSQLVNLMAKDEGVDEVFKRRDQLAYVQCMNSIRNRAEEIVLNELINQ